MKMQIQTSALITYDTKYQKSEIKYSLQPIDFYDTLTFKKLSERKIQIKKEDGFKIPTNDTNPVFKVATALQNAKPGKFGVSISIQKDIPTFSGLNSQISNAAGVMITLNKLWKLNLNEKQLIQIAKSVDSKIAQILKIHFKPKNNKNKKIVLIRPKYIVINENWINKKIKYFNKAEKNPFEAVIFKYFPDLKEVTNKILKIGARKYGMSGKGPIIFGLFDKSIDKKKIKKEFDKKIDFIWMGETCNKCIQLIN